MGAFAGQCCAALEALAKICAVNQLGLSNTVNIAEACDIDSIPDKDPNTHTISGDIVMDPGMLFYQWTVSEVDLAFNATTIGSIQNQTFQSTLTVFIPVTRDEADYIINQIVNGDFVVIFTKKDGRTRIMGDDMSTVKIPEGGIQQVTTAERDGITITFQYIGATPCYYTGVIPV